MSIKQKKKEINLLLENYIIFTNLLKLLILFQLFLRGINKATTKLKYIKTK